jgi:hypothetical protein
MEAVLSLHEPYRTTISLRFLDSLAPRVVARRMNVPVKTVHTRVERGLGILRVKLDGSFDSRQAWLGLLTPISLEAFGGSILGTTIIGAFLMTSVMKLSGAVTCLALLAFLVGQSLERFDRPDAQASKASPGVEVGSFGLPPEPSNSTLKAFLAICFPWRRRRRFQRGDLTWAQSPMSRGAQPTSAQLDTSPYGSVTLGSQAIQIEQGTSPLTRADDSALTLVLFKDGSELVRMQIELRAGEVNEIDL